MENDVFFVYRLISM